VETLDIEEDEFLVVFGLSSEESALFYRVRLIENEEGFINFIENKVNKQLFTICNYVS